MTREELLDMLSVAVEEGTSSLVDIARLLEEIDRVYAEKESGKVCGDGEDDCPVRVECIVRRAMVGSAAVAAAAVLEDMGLEEDADLLEECTREIVENGRVCINAAEQQQAMTDALRLLSHVALPGGIFSKQGWQVPR